MPQRKSDRFIGGYQIVAGAAGILMAVVFGVVALSRTDAAAPRLSIALAVGIMIAAFAAVVLAGVLLLEGHPAGRKLSTAVQALQVLIIVTASWYWVFFAGAYLELAWLGGRPRLLFGLKADLEFAWGGAHEVTGFGINVIPLILLVLLWRRSSELAAPSAPAGSSETASTGAGLPGA